MKDSNYREGVIIKKTRELLEEKGDEIGANFEAITIREITKRAGVSRNTIYRYFADKEALLAEVATLEFRGLTKGLNQVRSNLLKDPMERFKDAGLQYGSFGLDENKRYRFPLMFGTLFSKLDSYPELREAALESFDELVEIVKDCHEDGKISEDPYKVAFAAWGTVHGLVILALSNVLGVISEQKKISIDETIVRSIAKISVNAFVNGLREN
jgi:AcrR family transcriptional regulator